MRYWFLDQNVPSKPRTAAGAFGFSELEDAVAKWVHKVGMPAFTAAANELYGRPRDVIVSLCEDRQTVLLYLNYDDDAATRCASFKLAEPLPADEKFNAAFYEAMLR